MDPVGLLFVVSESMQEPWLVTLTSGGRDRH